MTYTWQQIVQAINKAKAQNKTNAQIVSGLWGLGIDANVVQNYLNNTTTQQDQGTPTTPPTSPAWNPNALDYNLPWDNNPAPSPQTQINPPTGSDVPQQTPTPNPNPAPQNNKPKTLADFFTPEQLNTSIQKAKDQGLTDEEIQSHLNTLIENKNKPVQAKPWATPLDQWLVWGQTEDQLFQGFVANTPAINNNSAEYRAAYTRYQTFQSIANSPASQIADQIYNGTLYQGSKVWNDLIANGYGDKLNQATTIANTNLWVGATNSMLGSIMWYDPTKGSETQMTQTFFQMPDYLQTLSDKYLSLLNDPAQAETLQSTLLENKDVVNQRNQIIETQTKINGLNEDMKNLEDDIKATMIDKGLSPNSSILQAMVLDKSKPITRQLEYLQNQYSSQTAVLDLLSQQVTAQFQVDQNRQQQKLQATQFLMSQAKDIYDKQYEYYSTIATENRADARDIALEKTKSAIAAQNPDLKFIAADKFGGDRYFNPVTKQITYLNWWPRWGGGGKWWASSAPKWWLVDLLQQYKTLLDNNSIYELTTDAEKSTLKNTLVGQITAKYKQENKLGTLDAGVQKLMSAILGGGSILSPGTYSTKAQSKAVANLLENMGYPQWTTVPTYDSKKKYKVWDVFTRDGKTYKVTWPDTATEQ